MQQSDMFVVMVAKTAEDLENMVEMIHLERLNRENDESSHPINFVLVHPKESLGLPTSFDHDS